jgi:hypothetical protein
VSTPEAALAELAAALREEGTLLTDHVAETDATPALGLLAAAGPRAQGAEADYAFVIEAIREGYLLHYAEPRVLATGDRDLALLAGDHLYALGLERLAALGDLEAVRELADLISLTAQAHAGGTGDPGAERLAAALWLGATMAVCAGPSDAHTRAKEAVRDGADAPQAADALAQAARQSAVDTGLRGQLEAAAKEIDFALPGG